jgi:hypothetical protein
MTDYVLASGVHTAKFTYTPPASYVGLSLNMDFYLSLSPTGATKDIDAGSQNFVAAAAGNSFTVSVTIPSTPNNYHAYVTIDDGTQFLVGFADTADNVLVAGGGTIGPISWTT